MITKELKRSFLSFSVGYLRFEVFGLKIANVVLNSQWFYPWFYLAALVVIVLLTFLLTGARW